MPKSRSAVTVLYVYYHAVVELACAIKPSARGEDSLIDAGDYVAGLERRQGFKIACLEEIALRQGYTTPSSMEPWLGKSTYASYVRKVAGSSDRAEGDGTGADPPTAGDQA